MKPDDLPFALLPAEAPAHASATPPAAASGALPLLALALKHAELVAAANAVLTELATRLGCDRVSLGLCRGGADQRLELVAVSSGAQHQDRQNAVRALLAAMQEAIDQASEVQAPAGDDAPPQARLAAMALHRAGDGLCILTLPIFCDEVAAGALVFERRARMADADRQLARDAASFVGPLLALKFHTSGSLRQRMWGAWRGGPNTAHHGPMTTWKLALCLGSLVIALAAFWPAHYRVLAPARIEGSVQRVIAAPADGFLRAAGVRPGETVKAGQVLAALDDREATLEFEKWAAEAAQLEKQYRDALAREDAAAIVIGRSKLEQAQAQVALARGQLDRTRLLAPFDGVLISGDLSASIGMPVRRGQELMTMAPPQAWRLVAEVEEHDIGELRVGHAGHALFAALADDPVPFTVTRIAPMAQTLGGRNVFEVEGRFESQAAGFKPGLRGVARVDIDERRLGLIWLQRVQHGARRVLWQLLG